MSNQSSTSSHIETTVREESDGLYVWAKNVRGIPTHRVAGPFDSEADAYNAEAEYVQTGDPS